MPLVSLQVITRGERELKDLMQSIKKQTVQDFEVVAVIPESDTWSNSLLRDSEAKVIQVPDQTRLLKARSIACYASTGLFSLAIDPKRLLKTNCLEELVRLGKNFDMVIVGEGSVGETYWAHLSELDRKSVTSEASIQRAIREQIGTAVPRFFKTSLQQQAYKNLHKKIPQELAEQITAGDDQLLFCECYRLSQSVGVTREILLEHQEDSSLKAIFKKYRWYGETRALLRGLPDYPQVNNLSSRIRFGSGLTVTEWISIQPLYLLRGLSFLIGYYLT
jgi:hypothetical protein